MNPRLARLQPYPFERWRELTRGVVPSAAHRPVHLGIGEPQHAAPALIGDALLAALPALASYPATVGEPALRDAIGGWVERRYGVALDPASQILPVNGSREALFAFAQTVVDGDRPGAVVVCPNPFYQIYEGAALLAGADVAFVPSDPARRYAADWDAVDDATWARTQLVYVCSPGNPTGAVMPLAEWRRLFELADRHGFAIASDECYSEIWFDDDSGPPLGSLSAARALGRDDCARLVMFTSLSKRSNVPGLRSGFVAGDRRLIDAFRLYRTYHGSAMGPLVQRASAAAWADEDHVVANRAAYRAKFDAVVPRLERVLDVQRPDAGFYLWAGVPGRSGDAPGAVGDDVAWARGLLAQYNVHVLPGSLLARAAPLPGGAVANPGAGRVRLALVAPLADCVDAAERIVAYSASTERGPA